MLYKYFFQEKLSFERKLVGYFAISLMLFALLLCSWNHRHENAFQLNSEYGWDLQHAMPVIIIFGLISSYFNSKLLLLSGFAPFIVFIVAKADIRYTGELLVAVSSIIILLNQFLPESRISTIVNKVKSKFK